VFVSTHQNLGPANQSKAHDLDMKCPNCDSIALSEIKQALEVDQPPFQVASVEVSNNENAFRQAID